jgi:hypothetical protein
MQAKVEVSIAVNSVRPIIESLSNTTFTDILLHRTPISAVKLDSLSSLSLTL